MTVVTKAMLEPAGPRMIDEDLRRLRRSALVVLAAREGIEVDATQPAETIAVEITAGRRQRGG